MAAPSPASPAAAPARAYQVGSRVLARPPADPNADDATAQAMDGERRVPGRVLGTRTRGDGAVEYKVSLDGYDSENDEWMEGDDERLRPYEAAADPKEATKREADEKVAARLHSEQRRHDGRREHGEAVRPQGAGVRSLARMINAELGP